MSAVEAARARQLELASKAEAASIRVVEGDAPAAKPKWTPLADFVAWWRRKKLENEKRMLRNEEIMKQDIERFLMEIEEQHTWVESELNYRNMERLKKEEVVDRIKKKEAARLREVDLKLNMEQGLKFNLGNVESFRRWQNSSAKYQDITGHDGAVHSVKLSPCLEYALSCSADCTARLWSLQEGKTRYPLLVYEGHTKKVIDCAIHPEFKIDEQISHIITCSGDGTLKLWGTRGERAMRTVDAHTEAVYRVTFSRDGRRVASASEDMTVRSWCFPEMYCLYIFQGHCSAVTSLDFSPTCRYLASGSDYGERKIFLWDSQMPRFEVPLQYPHMLFWSPEGVITKIIIRQFVPQETFWMTGDQMQYLGDDVSYEVWPGELDDVVVDDDSDSDASSNDEEPVDPLTLGDVHELNGLSITAVYTDSKGVRTVPTEYIPGGMLTIQIASQDVFISEAFLDVMRVDTQFDMYAQYSGQRLGTFIVNHPAPWEMETAIIDPLGWRKPRRPDHQIPGGLSEVDQSQAVVFRNSFETREKEPIEGIEMEEGEMEDVPEHPSKFDLVWFCPGPEMGPARISLNFRFHRSSQWETAKITLRESPKRIRTGVDNKAEAVLQYNFDQEARHRDFFRFIREKNWDAVEPFLDKKCVIFKEKLLKKRRWRCMDMLEDIFDHHKGVVLPSPIIFKGGLTKSVVVMEQCPQWHKKVVEESDDDEDDDNDDDEDEEEEDGDGEWEGEGDFGGAGPEGGGDDMAMSEDARTDAETVSVSESNAEDTTLQLLGLGRDDAGSREGSDRGSGMGSDRVSEVGHESDRVDSSQPTPPSSRKENSGDGGSSDGSPASTPRHIHPGTATKTLVRSPRPADGKEDSTEGILSPVAAPTPVPTPRPDAAAGRVVRFASEVQVEVFTVPDSGSPTTSSPEPHADALNASSHAPPGKIASMGLFDQPDNEEEEDEHGRARAHHLGIPEFIFTDEVVGKHFQRDILRMARKEANNVLLMQTTGVACAKEYRMYSTDPARQTELALIPTAPAWIRSSFLKHHQPMPAVKKAAPGYYDLKTHAFLKTDIFGPNIQKFSFPLPANYPRRAGAARNAFRLQLGEYERIRRKMANDAISKNAPQEEDEEDQGVAAEMRKFRQGMKELENAIKGQVALHLVSERVYLGTRRNALGTLPGMQNHYPNPFYREPCIEMDYMVPVVEEERGRFPVFMSLWGKQSVHAGKVPAVGRRPPPAVVLEDADGHGVGEGGEGDEEAKRGEAGKEGDKKERPGSGSGSEAARPASGQSDRPHSGHSGGSDTHLPATPPDPSHRLATGSHRSKSQSIPQPHKSHLSTSDAGLGHSQEEEEKVDEAESALLAAAMGPSVGEEAEEDPAARTAREEAEAKLKEFRRRKNAKIPQDVFLARRGSFPFAPGLEPFDNGVKDKVKTLHQEPEDSHTPGHRHHHHHHKKKKKKKGHTFVPNDEINTTETGGLLRVFSHNGRESAHNGAIADLKFAPSENRVASAGGDGDIKIWDPRDGTLVRVLRGHTGAVNCVAYTSDELYLVSCSADQEILVWDMTANTIFKRLRGHKDVVTSISISADCTLLLSSSYDKSIKSWYMTPRQPAAPEPPRVVFKTDTSVLIAWSAPPAFNLEITAFHLQSRIGLRGDWEPPESKPHTVMPTLRSGTIKGLAANTIYQFRVRAENLMGLGTWSAPSRLTPTERGLPGEVEIPKICGCSERSLTIYWFTPNPKAFAGASMLFEAGTSGEGKSFEDSAVFPFTLEAALAKGKDVLKYFRDKLAVKKVVIVQRKEKTQLEKEADMGFTIANEFMQAILEQAADDEYALFAAIEVTGLSPGFEYRVRVRGVNDYGPGPWSPASYSIMTLATPPNTPVRPFIESRTMTSIRFVWHAPDGNGSAVTNYILHVQQTGKEFRLPRSQLHWDLDHLLPGKKYFVRVLAMNAIGSSEFSDWNVDSYEQAQTLTDKPERPRNPRVAHGTWASMTLDIRLPYDNGDHITSMIVMQRWVQPFEKGDWSHPRTFALPDDVETVEWVDPDRLLKKLLEQQRQEEDERKAGYNPLKKKKDALDIAAVLSAAKPDGSVVRVVIGELQPDTIYEFRVACRNAAGFSPYSNPSHRAKTNKARLPSAPAEFYISDVNEHEVALVASWTEHGGAYIDRYSAEMLRKTGGERTFAVVWDRPAPLSAPLGPVVLSIAEHIHKATIYQFRVRAESDLGRGPFSEWSEDVLIPGESEEGNGGSSVEGGIGPVGDGDKEEEEEEDSDTDESSDFEGLNDVIQTSTGLAEKNPAGGGGGGDMKIKVPPTTRRA